MTNAQPRSGVLCCRRWRRNSPVRHPRAAARQSAQPAPAVHTLMFPPWRPLYIGPASEPCKRSEIVTYPLWSCRGWPMLTAVLSTAAQRKHLHSNGTACAIRHKTGAQGRRALDSGRGGMPAACVRRLHGSGGPGWRGVGEGPWPFGRRAATHAKKKQSQSRVWLSRGVFGPGPAGGWAVTRAISPVNGQPVSGRQGHVRKRAGRRKAASPVQGTGAPQGAPKNAPASNRDSA